MEKKPLIILTGPTAVGKTHASIELAKLIGGEIISADSMQVYKHMDIGSAKIKTSEMSGIKHYLIDILEPDEEFNVTIFQKLAKEALNHIYQNGKIPIVAGGTGFYIQALLYDIDFTKEDGDHTYRNKMEEYAKANGGEGLHEYLKTIDPKAAEEIHANNVKRVIRAIEFYHLSGRKISEHNEEERQKESPYNYAYFVLDDERSILYDRIDRRVDEMMKEGLLEEVTGLWEKGYTTDLVSMQGIGYKEIMLYLKGECTLENAVYTIKKDTRHFAKRQLTWFKREKDVIWIHKDELDHDENKVLEKMKESLKERNIF